MKEYAEYNGQYTGAQIDNALNKALNALPRDGSKPMTGNLNIEKPSWPIFRIKDTTLNRHVETLISTAGNVCFNNKQDDNNYRGLIVTQESNDFTTALEIIQKSATYGDKKFSVLHTGNKPSGSYTGNGSATSRTIETGGIGEAILIYSSYGIAIVTRRCTAILEPGGLNSLAASMVGNFVGGKLGLITTERALNNNSTEYYYQVL